MESITTSAMIKGIVAYLGGRLSKDESINKFISEFSGATVDWIKPLFLKEDDTEKEIIKNLKEKPESEARKKAIESVIEFEVEDKPETIDYIKDMFEKISKTEEGAKIVNNITNSVQTITGNIKGNINQIYNEK